MLVRLVRILLGFVAACLGAGLTMVLFVLTPSEIIGLPPDVRADRLAKAMELAGIVASQFALFSAPFALVAASLAELLRNRSWIYYVIVGLIITGLGFFAQHATERIGQPTIANRYALTAFLTSGFVAGLIFWVVSGRFAGSGIAQPSPPRALPAYPRPTVDSGSATAEAAASTRNDNAVEEPKPMPGATLAPPKQAGKA